MEVNNISKLAALKIIQNPTYNIGCLSSNQKSTLDDSVKVLQHNGHFKFAIENGPMFPSISFFEGGRLNFFPLNPSPVFLIGSRIDLVVYEGARMPSRTRDLLSSYMSGVDFSYFEDCPKKWGVESKQFYYSE